MWLWMPFLLCRPHATLAESSLSTWSPVLLCSGVPNWDRASLPKDLCSPPTTPDMSQQLLHPTLLPDWASYPSQTLTVTELWLWLCQTRQFLLLNCWPFWNIFHASARDEGILTFWKSCLCCCFLSLVSWASAVTSQFAVEGLFLQPICTI